MAVAQGQERLNAHFRGLERLAHFRERRERRAVVLAEGSAARREAVHVDLVQNDAGVGVQIKPRIAVRHVGARFEAFDIRAVGAALEVDVRRRPLRGEARHECGREVVVDARDCAADAEVRAQGSRVAVGFAEHADDASPDGGFAFLAHAGAQPRERIGGRRVGHDLRRAGFVRRKAIEAPAVACAREPARARAEPVRPVADHRVERSAHVHDNAGKVADAERRARHLHVDGVAVDDLGQLEERRVRDERDGREVARNAAVRHDHVVVKNLIEARVRIGKRGIEEADHRSVQRDRTVDDDLTIVAVAGHDLTREIAEVGAARCAEIELKRTTRLLREVVVHHQRRRLADVKRAAIVDGQIVDVAERITAARRVAFEERAHQGRPAVRDDEGGEVTGRAAGESMGAVLNRNGVVVAFTALADEIAVDPAVLGDEVIGRVAAEHDVTDNEPAASVRERRPIADLQQHRDAVQRARRDRAGVHNLAVQRAHVLCVDT
eukprot:Opistho-1_new@91903